jgi:uncharacterized protein involved in outer membrane biogenesis
MKALRIVLYVLTGLIVVLVVAAVIIVRSFDLNDYKDEITAYVQDRTGRTLTIGNNIEFSLFPWFAVETGDVSLSDDPRFGDRSFITIDSLSARVRVWPLLRRRIEIGRVVLDGIDLNLGMDADGSGNWATLVQAGPPEAPAIDPPGTQRPSIQQFAVEGIEFRNTRILWHDDEGEVTYILRDLTLNTGPINDNDPVDVAVSLSVLDVATQASVELNFQSIAALRPNFEIRDIDGSVRLLDPREQERATASFALDTISREENSIRTGPLSVTASLLRPFISLTELAIEANIASIDLDTGTEQLVINGFSARSGALSANLDIRGDAVLSDPTLTGTIDLRSDTIAALFDTLGSESPAELRAADVGGVVANAQFDLALMTQDLTVSRFAVNALGLEATGKATRGAGGMLIAEIEVPPFQPSESLIALLEARLPDGVDVAAITSARIAANLEWASATGALQIPTFAVDLDETALSGSMTIDDIGAPQRLEGQLTASGLDNRLLGAAFGPWLPVELIETDLGTFHLQTDFNYATASRIAVFAPLQLTAYGLSGEGQLTVVNADDALNLSGRAALAAFSPRTLLQRFELPVPQTSDPTVFRTAELAASFETNGARGEFREIAIELDDSRITGEFNVENFADPTYRFVLRADRIDADRYLPPKAQPAPDANSTDDRLLGDIRLASEPLTNTNVSGTASVGHLKIGGMDFEQLATEVAFGDGGASLNSVRTQLYGGEFDGGLNIDATGEVAEVRLRGDLKDVQIRPLLEAMLGSANMSGTGNVGLDLTGRGNTINEALQSATGRLNVEFTNGEIQGVNLGRKLCQAVNSGRGLPAPAAAPNVTAYTAIRGSSVVSDGNASSSDLYATTGYLQLTGRGGVRLVDQWIDNQYRAEMTGPIPISGCEDLNRTIANDPIPVNFTLQGRLPDIDVGVDISQLLQDWARREIRNQVRDAAADRLQDTLRDLFN